MKRVFVYVGSRKKLNSNTLEFIKITLEKLCLKYNENLEYDIYTPNNVSINNCIGCSKCFDVGKCYEDNNDDMGILRNKMIKADFIVFATPIYALSMTADMKCFIDRMSSWTHIMRLAGKPAIAITTSNGNGAQYALDYLYMIMSHLGLDVVRCINVNIFDYKQFNETYVQEQCQKCSDIIYNYIEGIENVKSNDALERIFMMLKRNMLIYDDALKEKRISKDDIPYEYTYWKENGYLDLDTFKELL